MTGCPKCGGEGWTVVERDGVSGAVRCDCLAAARGKRIDGASNIPPLYHDASFDNFDVETDRQLIPVLTRVKQYTRDFPLSDKPGLLLLGEPGTGKTHLAVAALRALMAKGFAGMFFDYQNLLQRIRQSYDAASGSTDREVYRFALDADVLLIDDLGAHRVTDWVEDTVTEIITYRCNHQKPLIATTNLPDPEAGDVFGRKTSAGGTEYRKKLGDHIGMRARSRLFEMCRVVRMPAVNDYRLREKAAR